MCCSLICYCFNVVLLLIGGCFGVVWVVSWWCWLVLVGCVDGFGGDGGVGSVGGVGVGGVGGVSGVGGGVVSFGLFCNLFCTVCCCFGVVLVLFWCCFGVVLVLFWYCFVVVLVLFWCCFGGVGGVMTTAVATQPGTAGLS